MKTGQPLISRPAWHDRNPVLQTEQYYGGNVAPHSAAERWTYTVPSGKKAFVEYLFLRVARRSAASAVGIVELYINVTGAGADSGRFAEAAIYTNGVGDRDTVSIGQSIILLAGDQLIAYTVDTSTGGTIDYYTVAKITEFDA